MELNAVTEISERLEKNSLESKDVNEETVNSHNDEDPKLPLDVLVKHPLQNRWAFWYFKLDKNKDWKLSQKVIATFDTVEDFWAVFNHIQPASGLQMGCDYSVFKEGIEPMWEDPQNRRGGRWVVNLERRKRNELDSFWLETLLCLIGEAFEDLSDEICGAVINLRGKGDKLGLWTADATKNQATIAIGRTLKSRLNISNDITIGYETHQDSQKKSGSMTKNRYFV